MLGEFRLLGVLNDDLVRLRTSDVSGNYGAQLWSSIKLSKSKDCVRCETKLTAGARAFKPITNGYNRMHRICASCVERLKPQHETP